MRDEGREATALLEGFGDALAFSNRGRGFLYDPFKLSRNKTPEQKQRGLLVELNNGRLAMIGIFGFMAESKVPGSVPALEGLIKPYAGEYMAPFTAAASEALYQ